MSGPGNHDIDDPLNLWSVLVDGVVRFFGEVHARVGDSYGRSPRSDDPSVGAASPVG
jgi:hypothetical protein